MFRKIGTSKTFIESLPLNLLSFFDELSALARAIFAFSFLNNRPQKRGRDTQKRRESESFSKRSSIAIAFKQMQTKQGNYIDANRSR